MVTGEVLMTEEPQTVATVREAVSIVDIDVFEAVYRAWAPHLYAYCFRRLRSVENAEDATSQIFQQAFRGRAGFQGGSVPAWLFRIAQRVIVDHYRATKLVSSIELAGEVIDNAPGPEVEVLRNDEAERLQRAMSDLSEPRRQVIELRLAGLTSPEIAQILGRSPEWVRTNQRRAVVQLQAALHVFPAQGRPSDD